MPPSTLIVAVKWLGYRRHFDDVSTTKKCSSYLLKNHNTIFNLTLTCEWNTIWFSFNVYKFHNACFFSFHLCKYTDLTIQVYLFKTVAQKMSTTKCGNFNFSLIFGYLRDSVLTICKINYARPPFSFYLFESNGF